MKGNCAASPTGVFQSDVLNPGQLNRFLTAFNIEYPGPVDQLEDRHFGMVEVVGSNPTRSIPIYGLEAT